MSRFGFDRERDLPWQGKRIPFAFWFAVFLTATQLLALLFEPHPLKRWARALMVLGFGWHARREWRWWRMGLR